MININKLSTSGFHHLPVLCHFILDSCFFPRQKEGKTLISFRAFQINSAVPYLNMAQQTWLLPMCVPSFSLWAIWSSNTISVFLFILRVLSLASFRYVDKIFVFANVSQIVNYALLRHLEQFLERLQNQSLVTIHSTLLPPHKHLEDDLNVFL